MIFGITTFGLITSAFVAAGVFVPIWAVFRYPVPSEPPIHRRVAQAVGLDRSTVFENPILAPVMSILLGIGSRIHATSLRNRIRRDLNSSGNPNGYTIDQHIAICLGGSLFAGTIAVIFDMLVLKGQSLFFTLPFFSLFGFWIPLLVLRTNADNRITKISKQLPYTLDLIALVIASGSNFTEAVETLVRDDPENPFNQELSIVMAEINLGAPRSQALRNMAARIPLDSIQSVVGAIEQAELLGTPLASILKTQSEMIRMHRSVRAEKLAASASLRILIPTMVIMVAIITMVMVPFIISYVKNGVMF